MAIKFDKIEFGDIVINGVSYDAKDLLVFYDGTIKEREKSHVVSKKEIEEILRERKEIEEIIVALGFSSCVGVEPEAKSLAEERGVKVTELKTREACMEFEKRVSEGKRVALILHSTC